MYLLVKFIIALLFNTHLRLLLHLHTEAASRESAFSDARDVLNQNGAITLAGRYLRRQTATGRTIFSLTPD